MTKEQIKQHEANACGILLRRIWGSTKTWEFIEANDPDTASLIQMWIAKERKLQDEGETPALENNDGGVPQVP